jgi:hypothetical protein
MTTKPKARADEEPASVEETKSETPRCGAPHSLPLLAPHVTCQMDAQDPDRPFGSDHEHRHEDGDTIYVWR